MTKPSRTLRELGKRVHRFRRYIAVPLAAFTLLWLRPLLPAGSPFVNELTDWLVLGSPFSARSYAAGRGEVMHR